MNRSVDDAYWGVVRQVASAAKATTPRATDAMSNQR
jgi:hypothetical protein